MIGGQAGRRGRGPTVVLVMVMAEMVLARGATTGCARRARIAHGRRVATSELLMNGPIGGHQRVEVRRRMDGRVVVVVVVCIVVVRVVVGGRIALVLVVLLLRVAAGRAGSLGGRIGAGGEQAIAGGRLLAAVATGGRLLRLLGSRQPVDGGRIGGLLLAGRWRHSGQRRRAAASARSQADVRVIA